MQLMPGDVVNEKIVSFERNVHIGNESVCYILD